MTFSNLGVTGGLGKSSFGGVCVCMRVCGMVGGSCGRHNDVG